jgi:hypothetical protein
LSDLVAIIVVTLTVLNAAATVGGLYCLRARQRRDIAEALRILRADIAGVDGRVADEAEIIPVAVARLMQLSEQIETLSETARQERAEIDARIAGFAADIEQLGAITRWMLQLREDLDAVMSPGAYDMQPLLHLHKIRDRLRRDDL